ncbi:universal stress protein UspA [Aeromonas australiensis]|uniref:universal stress protein n=1 Tax=Aeromonas australiensis TaxID=1114880 RepID=UPI001F3A9A01|nr:universal stress protein [Aeromonas australiensis]MCF3098868.1 universal stress protein UspA [Aeromonas australiensis]
MKPFKHIAFVLDNQHSYPSPALLRAIKLAENHQAALTLLKIVPPIPSFVALASNGPDIRDKFVAREEQLLAELVASLSTPVTMMAHLLIGKRYIEIIHQVQRQNIDLVIKEPDTMDWLDRLFGSDDMHLLRKCPCPVWLMQKSDSTECKHILAAVAFNEESHASEQEMNDRILDYASALAMSDFATLHVLHCYETPEAGFISLWAEHPDKVEKEMTASEHASRKGKMQLLMNRLKTRIGNDNFDFLSPSTHLIQGPPDLEIPRMATRLNADLVVMGTVARSGVTGVIIGNTAESVLSQLHCSVFAIKPQGFISPLAERPHQ